MTGLVRNGSAPWFAPLYGADGSVFLTVKAQGYLPQCTFFLVTYAPSGFIAMPFGTELDEFYVGWAPQPMREGQERTVQIGGFIGPVLTNSEDGAWLKRVDGETKGVASPHRPKDSFGYALENDRAMLFPVMIRKDAS